MILTNFDGRLAVLIGEPAPGVTPAAHAHPARAAGRTHTGHHAHGPWPDADSSWRPWRRGGHAALGGLA
jgi:hypothetical protein